MLDRGKLSLTGRYGIATGGAVTDPVLLSVAADFDNQVMRKISGLSPADLVARCRDDSELLVTTKYDGEGVFVYYEQGADAFAFSPAGRVRLGFPALDELAARLEAQNVRRVLLRCELCLAHHTTGQRDGVAEVIRVSFSGDAQALARLKLVGLDVVMLDGRDLRANQVNFAETFELLGRLCGTDEAAKSHRMHGVRVPERDAPKVFEALLESGAEGIVVRRLNRAEAWKVKPHKSIDAVVIGFIEGEFEGQYGVMSLLTGLTYPFNQQDVLMQTFVRVGSGLSDAQRVAMLERLRPLKVSQPLAMTDSSGRAVQFVRPRLIAEIHGEDLLSAEAGRELKTQALRWDEASQAYEFIGLSNCPRLTFARFERLREDKEIASGGARMAQVSALEQPTTSAASGDPIVRIVRRECYAKGEMLRKLVVVHKANADVPFPYLIYWTDYSAKRAEPLKVSLEVALTEERAMALAERALQEGLTKGFVAV